MLFKKKHILPIVLIILIVLAIVFRKEKSTFNRHDKNLHLKNSEKVDRIAISNSAEKFELIKQDDLWRTSDENTANAKMIYKLFKALKNIQMQSAVIAENKTELLHRIEESGTVLKLFSDNYLLYDLKFAINKKKNYVLTKAGNLYYISIKGHGEKLLKEFLRASVSDWYDKILINLKPNDITNVLLDYSEHNNNNFFIDNKNQKSILLDNKQTKVENVNSETINDYLHYFSGIKYEILDTTQQIPNPTKQLFRLNINTSISKTIHIVGFELVNKQSLETNTIEFAGIVNNRLLVKLSYSDFDPILVKRNYFLKK